jgi:hypothetical protein
MVGTPAPWSAECPYCEVVFPPRVSWRGAWNDAIEHATEEPCDGLRLAALVRELEALRDTWRAVGQAGLDTMPYTYRNLARHWIYRADDLAAVLARAAGGTG